MASRLIDLISIKTNCTCSTLFLLISKKKYLHVQYAFLSFPCRCFARLQRCVVRLKRQTSLLHIIFMEELSYLLTQYFVSCVHVRFYFSLPLIFTLLAAHCWPLAFLIFSPPLWISMFFFLQSSSPLFSITRSSSFSVVHVCVNTKNNGQKDTTLLLFFFLKVRAATWFPSK